VIANSIQIAQFGGGGQGLAEGGEGQFLGFVLVLGGVFAGAGNAAKQWMLLLKSQRAASL
jgi:hypothetical protein